MSGEALELRVATDPVRVVQITDTHLNRNPGGTLLGLDTDFSLQQVVKLVREQRTQIDLLLGTGDISDHGSEEAYHRARDYFSELCPHAAWLAGNHDLLENMQKVLGRDGELVRVIYAGNWQIVMLNSQIPGEVGGELGADELGWLEQCLLESQARNLHSLICLHHQPVPMGSAWIDDQKVLDGEAFFACLERFPQVRGVLWGHVHQHLDKPHGELQLMSTPSTCIQFAPQSGDFKVDDLSPGYRWLDLHADGRIETAVSRVEGVDFPVDLESQGYI
jgi:3',5'-cyclic-AMP phosphodiesterase